MQSTEIVADDERLQEALRLLDRASLNVGLELEPSPTAGSVEKHLRAAAESLRSAGVQNTETPLEAARTDVRTDVDLALTLIQVLPRELRDQAAVRAAAREVGQAMGAITG